MPNGVSQERVPLFFSFQSTLSRGMRSFIGELASSSISFAACSYFEK